MVYRDRKVLSVVMQNIISRLQAFHLSINQEDMDKKLRNLRQPFNRVWGKVRASRKSGAGAAEVYRSTWRYYVVFIFLSATEMEAEKEDSMSQKKKRSHFCTA